MKGMKGMKAETRPSGRVQTLAQHRGGNPTVREGADEEVKR
jgi:hypothetical protein